MRSLFIYFMLAISGTYLQGEENLPVKSCASCEYNGGIFKIKLDQESGKYLRVSFAQCEVWNIMIPDSCSSSPYTLFLKGHVDGKEVEKVFVLEVTYKMGYYEVSDTLAMTGKNRTFSFKVNDKQLKYLAIIQEDKSLVMYDMSRFNKLTSEIN